VKWEIIILVCDIGAARPISPLISVSDEGGELELKRVAVGRAYLARCDNMDLALAYAVQQRSPPKGTKLDACNCVG